MVSEHLSWLSLWPSSPRKKKKKMMKKMSLISSIFIAEKSLPKEDMQKEEEEPCTSSSHQGDKEISKRKIPSSGEEKEKGDKLTQLLPKSVHMIHEEFEEIRREYMESPREFDSKANSRLEECEHGATHHIVQCSHMPKIFGREMRRKEEVARRETLSDFLEEYGLKLRNSRVISVFQIFAR